MLKRNMCILLDKGDTKNQPPEELPSAFFVARPVYPGSVQLVTAVYEEMYSSG